MPAPSPSVPSVGVFTLPRRPHRLSLPTVAVILPPNSPVGLRVMKLIAPPVELRPYSVPCGPRSTSTRSSSATSSVEPTCLPISTPSMYCAMAWSTDRLAGLPPATPRIVTALVPREPGEVKPPMLGMVLIRSAALLTPRRSMSVALSAEIEIGTACRFSSRFCAVTTISSMPRSVTFCATASSASSRLPAATMPSDSADFLKFARFMSQCLLKVVIKLVTNRPCSRRDDRRGVQPAAPCSRKGARKCATVAAGKPLKVRCLLVEMPCSWRSVP